MQTVQVLNYGNQFVSTAADAASTWRQWLQVDKLRYYFAVDNSYVKNKIQLLLFPFQHKTWFRLVDTTQQDITGVNGGVGGGGVGGVGGGGVGGGVVFLPPKNDLNAPDLYLPLMSFITYVLLVAFLHGTNYQFTPEVLGSVFSSGCVVIGLEVLLIKAAFYFLASQISVSLLDLLAYSSYIFVQIILNTLVGQVFGKFLFWCSLLWTSFNMAVFIVKTLRLVLLPESAVRGIPTNGRNYFLVFLALLQAFITYFLSYPPS